LLLSAGSIDIMSTPEDVAEQQRRLKPGVVVAQHLFNRVRALTQRGNPLSILWVNAAHRLAIAPHFALNAVPPQHHQQI
jgi:hypothetical protein